MNKDLFLILSELLEVCSQSSKLLISSQLALDDGDIVLSQKHFKNAKDILNTAKNDCFEEIKEILNCNITESSDYDISSLNLAIVLNDVCHEISTLISMECENQTGTIREITCQKLIKNINACNELYDTLFN